MPTGTFILTEGDDEDTPMSNVISLTRPAREPIALGDLAAVIVSDLAVRLRGDFQLPKIVARLPVGGARETGR